MYHFIRDLMETKRDDFLSNKLDDYATDLENEYGCIPATLNLDLLEMPEAVYASANGVVLLTFLKTDDYPRIFLSAGTFIEGSYDTTTQFYVENETPEYVAQFIREWI